MGADKIIKKIKIALGVDEEIDSTTEALKKAAEERKEQDDDDK